MGDDVINPDHYTRGDIECIDAIESALGANFNAYLQGNVIKYIWRYKYKGGVKDLEKAQVYLGWLKDFETKAANKERFLRYAEAHNERILP